MANRGLLTDYLGELISVVHKFSAIVIPMERSDEQSLRWESGIPLSSDHRNDES